MGNRRMTRLTNAMAAGITSKLWEMGDMMKVLKDWEATKWNIFKNRNFRYV